ncbi:MAG: glycosyltransferase [Pseudomonadota bacterium]
MTVAAIAIGRNEGARLVTCLASLMRQASPVIYVDSGSTDGSVEAAQAAGAEVVELDLSVPFTAARARNAGLARLAELDPDGVFVQLVDGDCELRDGWIDAALAAITADDRIAVVCGRRRERFPEASRWNKLTDAEWDTPIGEAIACGGDALIRRAALAEVGGYPEDMIAGEEPEMCFRMREKGWRILRIDAEMTWHDAALTRMSQWWKRSKRAGHAFAEGAYRHGRSPERFRMTEVRRALMWGAGVPLLTVLGLLFFGPSAVFLLLLWPAQALRLSLKGTPLQRAWFLTLGKVPEALGVVSFHWARLRGQQREIIEYK